MPHSLRVRLKNLNYKGLLTDRELNRLVNALDTVDAVEDIKAEIEEKISRNYGSMVECGMGMALETIDRHIGDKK
jgi:hypothetical protein